MATDPPQIVGALASKGAFLDELLTACEEVSMRYSTLGVAMSGCTLPGHTQPLFTVPHNMIELGLGAHGEAGCETLQVTIMRLDGSRESVSRIHEDP